MAIAHCCKLFDCLATCVFLREEQHCAAALIVVVIVRVPVVVVVSVVKHKRPEQLLGRGSEKAFFFCLNVCESTYLCTVLYVQCVGVFAFFF